MVKLIADARAFAVMLRHPGVGTEHLLMALASSGPAGEPLRHAGLTVQRIVRAADDLRDGDALDRLDGRALAAVGIDVEAVRAALQRSFGTGTLPPTAAPNRWRRLFRRPLHRRRPALTRRAADALTAAVVASDRAPDAIAVALAVLDQHGGPVPLLLDRLEVDRQRLRTDLARRRCTGPSKPTVRRAVLIRLGGLAAILGGALTAASSAIHFHGASRPLVPLGVACLAVGVVGLRAAMWGREVRLRRWGSASALVGIGLGVTGMAGSALGVVGAQPLARAINTGEHLGLVFIGGGMLAWGFAGLRAHALRRWSAAPVIIGLFALAGLVSFSPRLFAIVEASPVPALFGLSWTLLGVGLLAITRGHRIGHRPVQ
jgi:hypothetical protein